MCSGTIIGIGCYGQQETSLRYGLNHFLVVEGGNALEFIFNVNCSEALSVKLGWQ